MNATSAWTFNTNLNTTEHAPSMVCFSQLEFGNFFKESKPRTLQTFSFIKSDSTNKSYKVLSSNEKDITKHLYTKQFFVSAFGGTTLISANYATLPVNHSSYGMIVSGGVGFNRPNASLFSLGEFNYFNSFLVAEATAMFYLGLFKNTFYLELGMGGNHSRGNLNTYWFYYPTVALSILPEFDPYISSRDRDKYVFKVFSNLNVFGPRERLHHNEFIGLSIGRRIGKQ